MPDKGKKAGLTREEKRARKRARAGYGEDWDEIDADNQASRVAASGCLVAFLAVVVAISVVAYGLLSAFLSEIRGENATVTGVVEIDIPSGAGGRTVGLLLMNEGFISNDNFFRLYVRITGAGQEIRPGKHTLTGGMSYDEIIKEITNAPPEREEVWVTIPEGSTVEQFGRRFEEAGICTAEEFVAAANDIEAFPEIEIFKHIDFDPNTYMRAEGYLAPDTYRFYVDETPHNLALRLYQQTDKIFTEEMYARAEEVGLSIREVFTLASIVEEESSLTQYQPGIARVFLNRLTKDLDGSGLTRRTLGTDATRTYLRDWVVPAFGGDEASVPHDMFYGYYTQDDDPESREGVPIGPISSPSKIAIDAVLWPSDEKEHVDAFYFRSDLYGEFYYAKTFTGHVRNGDIVATENEKYYQENPDKRPSSD